MRPVLYLFQAAVAFVPRIGCVNVANLLLVRSNVRMREWAVRFSLGASRFLLARQLLAESSVLAVGGRLLGALVSFGSVRLLETLGAETLGADALRRGNNISVNAHALAFAAICVLLNGFRLGLNSRLLRVIGVTGSVKNTDLAETNRPGEIYLLLMRSRKASGSGGWR